MKSTTHQDLAILGGPPAFTEKLHVGRPNVGSKASLMERVSDIVDRRWLTNNGPYVQGFERRVAEMCGTRHCVAMSNGTIGLEIMIRAAGLGGEVIIPSFTFVATAHALQWQEIRPVFCDVDPATHCLDPDRVEELITPRTTAIIGVHCWGHPAPAARLQEIADRHGLQLFFDAAHGFGCAATADMDRPNSGRPRMIGSLGRAETFSFHATKIVNCFEGGAVTTDDDELAETMRLMRNFGFEGKDNVVYIGSNGKMNEVSAAMGLTSLDSYEDFVEANRRNYLAYREQLGSLPGFEILEHDGSRPHNFHYVVFTVDEDVCGLTRDEVVAALEAENVLARRYFYPGTHNMEPYRSHQPQARLVLQQTEALMHRVMTLPTGATVGPDDIRTIGGIVERAVTAAPAVRAAVARGRR
ncbi:MAG: aminotransferase class I/II-fold pyridoxal phosphate-dependent enzyme [Planctomycetota bacterium]